MSDAEHPVRRSIRYLGPIICTCAAVAGAAQVRPATPEPLPPDSVVQSLLNARLAFMPNAGLVVGLLDPYGRRVLSAGTLNGRGTPTPNARTVFEIGSVTKTFTATMLADMARDGEVRLDQPVAELLPDWVTVPSRDDMVITLLDLATQRSGLPRLPTNFAPKDMSNPYADYTPADLYAFLSSYTLPRDPDEEYEYSNLGMGLLGFALARYAGVSYEDLVRRRVTEPLHMPDTRITLTPSMETRLAPGHNATGDVVPNWDIPTLAGAGALRSTVSDLLTFVEAYLSPDSAGTLGPAMEIAALPRRPTTIPNTHIGLAWHIREAAGKRIVWHNGGTGGYHAFVAFDRDRAVGVVILSNSPVFTDDVGMHLLNSSVAITSPSGGGR